MISSRLVSLGARTGPRRFMSTASKLTTVEVNDKTGIATLTMCRPPVNGQNLELLLDIKSSIKEIENNSSRGLIITSASPKVFCAGLDILEMYKPEQQRLRAVWTELQNVWCALYGISMPTAAAINGHAPAGGCLLATACEYRVMVPDCRIGLNETQLGIIAPKWLVSGFLNVLPKRVAERALTQSRLFTTDEALQEGLIDEIATSKEEAVEKCAAFIGTFARVNPVARALTKQQFRADNLRQFHKEREQDVENFLSLVNRPEVQKGIGLYLQGLKKKKANKK
ncbi:enoyl-CoA delta isomerase 1, mitochondrial-like [Drosophila subobscura]|uniref:enoyl-CoA delta isomerase 1, mitochondrial-like n=1 Tax=Drosophila subobscura TaxID=7241 RepID=UPI00155A3033|nr:enoyl-CoA delta isomerase 1, mitochondrial-like [Drosophila subobscura]XP_034668972.1 enoyl-CoA delta isomerase 1, mitochondrial-like [Drosophila subobscura]